MRAFTDIAGQSSTSLDVVAPGIAEALFATALGLFAAIPAVIFYNKLSGDADKITLRLGERDAGFEVGPVKVTTRLIEGDFPNYRGLIPSNHPNALTVDREALLDAVRRVRLLAQESTPVRLAMSSEGLQLVAVTQDVGQAHEAVEASYSGDELTVAFNPEYLIDGIEVAPGDEIILETVDELKPALLKSSDDPNFLYLLMPVRVS